MSKIEGIPKMGKNRTQGLGSVVLKILAVGIAGSAALIGGAKKIGDKIEKKK